jgi:hypothetical protein
VKIRVKIRKHLKVSEVRSSEKAFKRVKRRTNIGSQWGWNSHVTWSMSSSAIWKPRSNLAGNTLPLRYRVQPVNALYGLEFSRRWLWRMPSSGMLRLIALVRTDVSKEPIAFIIRVTRIGELGTTLAVTSYRSTLVDSSVPNNGGDTFLCNDGSYKSEGVTFRRRHYSWSPPRKPQILQRQATITFWRVQRIKQKCYSCCSICTTVLGTSVVDNFGTFDSFHSFKHHITWSDKVLWITK